METHVLVDYHNLPRKLMVAGVTWLAQLLDSQVISLCPDTEETLFRLYGGWYDHGGLSRDGTRLSQEISQRFPQPVRKADGKLRYVRCEIATSLIGKRDEIFSATLRPRHGLDKFDRVPPPPACIDIASCTIHEVLTWSRKGCPKTGCPVVSQDVFVCNQQKLVDTLVCCDLLTLASSIGAVRLFLVSEDDDFIPALLLARLKGATVWHVRTKPAKVRLYDAVLQRYGVQVVSI